MSNVTPSYEFLAEKLKYNMHQVGTLQKNRTLENLDKIDILFEQQDLLMDSFLIELDKREDKTIEELKESLALLETLRDFGMRKKSS